MSKLTAGAVYRAAISAGFSPADAVIATQIAWAESGFDKDAVANEPNGTKSYGLMQINSSHTSVLTNGSWNDPVANMRMAKAIKEGKDGSKGGWLNWSTFKSGKYKQVKVRGNPFSAGSQDMSFIVPGQPDSFAVTGSTKDPATTGINIGNPLEAVSKLVGAVMNPGLWARVGIGWLGTVLVVLGILFLFWQAKDKVASGVVGSVVKGATK